MCLHLRQQPLTQLLRPARSLDDNNLGSRWDSFKAKFVSEMSGILKLAEALPKSKLTSLR